MLQKDNLSIICHNISFCLKKNQLYYITKFSSIKIVYIIQRIVQSCSLQIFCMLEKVDFHQCLKYVSECILFYGASTVYFI